MRRLRWTAGCSVAALAATMAVAACADGTGPAGTATATAQPTVASPAGSTGPASSAPATRPPSPVPVKGVTVTVSASAYAVGETLRVTVANGLHDPIYTEDFQTECTIVTLQKSAAGWWNDIAGCGMGRPTRTVRLDPGTKHAVLLDPHSFHLAQGSGELGFGAGTYRIRFGYRLSPEPMGAQPLTAYSATFAVR